LLGEIVGQRLGAGRTAGWLLVELSEPLERGEDFVANFVLDGNKVEGWNTDGAPGANALTGDIEQLPVEIKALFRADEIAGEDPLDEQLVSDFERIHLRNRQVQQGARRPHHQRRHPCQAGGDGVSKGEAVEGRDFGWSEILEGQNEDGVLFFFGVGRLAKALGKHGKDAGGAFFSLGARGGKVRRGIAGDDAGFNLRGLHDGLEGLAHVGGAGIALGGILLKKLEYERIQLG
jgi:hypothetical protein